MIRNDAKKNTIVCKKNPNDVGHPPTATPLIKLFINLNVTGFATRKNINVEYSENFTFNPVDKVIYSERPINSQCRCG